MRTAFETVLEKMLLAGWLRDFRFIEGKGFHLGINEKGVEKLGVLKELGDLFGISDDDRRAVSLCIVSKGLAFPDSEWEVVGEIPAEVLDFVGSVLDELVSARAMWTGSRWMI